jgi:osmotically inducible protein OsmC
MRSGAGTIAYSSSSRFEEGEGTSPEELLAAAHAGCFSMALAAGLDRAGYTPESVTTTARVHIEQKEAGFRITRIELECEAWARGIDAERFQEVAEATKDGCPVSVALGAVPEISLAATLVS